MSHARIIVANLPRKKMRERQIKLSADRLSWILKKRGLFGSEQERATKKNKIQNFET